jgi:hypothetical protein
MVPPEDADFPPNMAETPAKGNKSGLLKYCHML